MKAGQFQSLSGDEIQGQKESYVAASGSDTNSSDDHLTTALHLWTAPSGDFDYNGLQLEFPGPPGESRLVPYAQARLGRNLKLTVAGFRVRWILLMCPQVWHHCCQAESSDGQSFSPRPVERNLHPGLFRHARYAQAAD